MSSLQQPDDISKLDVIPFSESVLTRGLKVIDAINGVGLVTNGLVWPAPQVWFDVNSSPVAIPVTVWVNEPASGMWGEVSSDYS